MMIWAKVKLYVIAARYCLPSTRFAFSRCRAVQNEEEREAKEKGGRDPDVASDCHRAPLCREPVLSQEERTTTNPKVQAITRWLRSQMKNSGVKPRPSSRPHLATRYAITYSATTPIRSNAARTKAAGRGSRFSAA